MKGTSREANGLRPLSERIRNKNPEKLNSTMKKRSQKIIAKNVTTTKVSSFKQDIKQNYPTTQ